MARSPLFQPGQKKISPSALNDLSKAASASRKALSFHAAGSIQTPIGTLQRSAVVAGRRGATPTPNGWHVTRAEDTDPESETFEEVTLTVKPGLRVVTGGHSTEEPSEVSIQLTEAQAASGVWVVKQFSNTANAWISGVQVVPASGENAEAIKDTLMGEGEAGDEEGEAPADDSDYINITPDLQVDFEQETATLELEVDYRLWPENIKRQVRVLAHVSGEGVVTQYAHGSIYAVGHDRILGEDVTEEEADEADEEAEGEDDCDQNDHPGDDEDDNEVHPGDDDDPGGDGEDGDDEDDDDHPGSEDCYTTN